MRKQYKAYFWLMGKYEEMEKVRANYLKIWWDSTKAYEKSNKLIKEYGKAKKSYDRKYGKRSSRKR